MEIETDKSHIGVIPAHKDLLTLLVQKGMFGEMADAARFAAAIAITNRSELRPVDGAGSNWHAPTVDPSGEFKRLIAVMYSEKPPTYRTLEQLIYAGCEIISAAVEKDGPESAILRLLTSRPA